LSLVVALLELSVIHILEYFFYKNPALDEREEIGDVLALQTVDHGGLSIG